MYHRISAMRQIARELEMIIINRLAKILHLAAENFLLVFA